MRSTFKLAVLAATLSAVQSAPQVHPARQLISVLSSVVASATESAASVTSSLSSVIESASTTASAESSTAEDASSSPYASTPTSFSSYTGTYSPNPAATGYKNLPPGGVGTDPNGPPPDYSPSDEFDLQSLILATYQEYIELDLFHNGLASYSTGEFDDAGIDESQRYLLQFMAEQEVGHSTAFNNMLPREYFLVGFVVGKVLMSFG